MLTASLENMLVTSINTTLETGVVPTQSIVIISTVRRHSDSDSRKLVSNVGSTWLRLLISAWVRAQLFTQRAKAHFHSRCTIYYSFRVYQC